MDLSNINKKYFEMIRTHSGKVTDEVVGGIKCFGDILLKLSRFFIYLRLKNLI